MLEAVEIYLKTPNNQFEFKKKKLVATILFIVLQHFGIVKIWCQIEWIDSLQSSR